MDSSKLDRATWMKFINCFVDRLPIRRCAANCGVSVPTAYSMQLRILTLIEQNAELWSLRAKERAQLDETYFHESFSGNHTKRTDFEMPRPAYIRGRKGVKASAGIKGLDTANHIYVITGVDESRRVFLEAGGRGHMTSDECEKVLLPKLKRGCAVTTDENPSYVSVLKGIGAVHSTVASADLTGDLNETNSFHSHLKNFMKPKRGVSTRRLHLYLAEFAWRWQVSKDDATSKQSVERIVRSIALTDFQTKVSDFAKAPHPFVEWWDTDEGRREARRLELNKIQRGINRAAREAAGDASMEAVVAERQRTLDDMAEAEGFSIRKGNVVRGKGASAPAPHMTLSMLKRTATA